MSDLEYRVGKLDLSPGDTLLVKIDRTLSDKEAGRVRDLFVGAVPNTVRVMVLDATVNLSIVTGNAADDPAGRVPATARRIRPLKG